MRSFALFFLLAVCAAPAIHQTRKPSPAQKSKTTSATPRPKASPKKAVYETTEWETIKTLTEPADRVERIKKFLADFPNSAFRDEAHETLAKLRSDIGNSQLVAGDLVAASDTFKAAAIESPSPIPAKLFVETYLKFPANLFFRGAQLEGYEIAKILEERAAENVDQLLSIAAFYISAELGADARRVAVRATELAPTSAAAYQMLGLASRMQFELEASHLAFEKAVALDANSISAKRGLAESKRALGRSEEAVTLYRALVEADGTSQGAKTGLILALFDADKRSEAEGLMDAALKATPDDVVLLAGVAYWYATRNEGDKAVEYGLKAVAANPRYVWSHLALGRGLLLQKKFVEADQALIGARRYGNFPTVEYEIARARAMAGFYREAADILEKTFTLREREIETALGGRVKRSAASLPELVGYERRSSIFTAAAADDSVTAEQLRALLEFRTAITTGTNVAPAAEKFVAGTDKMRLHRRLFAAGELLRSGASADIALSLISNAATLVSESLDVPAASAAVAADELYTVRALAATDDRYLTPPIIPRATLEAILRGRIDDLAGWALLIKGQRAEATTRLARATTTLPPNSAWWRAAQWRLGTALEAGAKNEEALEAYYKGYVGSIADPVKYAIVESLYKRVRGDTTDLEARIGPNPIAAQSVASSPEAAPVAIASVTEPAATPAPVKADESIPVPTPSPTPEKLSEKPLFEPVVIRIPNAQPSAPAAADPKPCTLTFSEETVTLKAGGKALSFIVGLESEGDLSSLSATWSSPADIEVRREPIAGIKGRAMYVLKSVSSTVGEFTVRFVAACGQKDLKVTVN